MHLQLTPEEILEIQILVKELGIELSDKIIIETRKNVATSRLRAIYENAFAREPFHGHPVDRNLRKLH
jgi:hypothetical protein